MQRRSHFTQKLEEVKMQVLRMAAMSEKAVGNAMQSFMEVDSDLAESVINRDGEINAIECDIDALNLQLLAMDQPVAGDLRFILGSMRITSNLERIADEAVNLGQRAVFLSTRPPLPFNKKMERLADICRSMLTDAISAFVNADPALASRICVRDHEADELHVGILKDLIKGMVSESRYVERGVHHIMASRHMERIADLSTNLAEAVIFIVEGEDVKHRCRG